MAQLIICADDFAMSEGVSRTIVELARSGKLNAISCMATSPRWPIDALLLRELQGVQFGLHLVLTEEQPLTDMPRLAPTGRLPNARRLARLAMLRRLPTDEIATEVRAQFERFEAILGFPPDFVDGHQHTHLLRGIRQIVVQETAQRAQHAWLRTCEDHFWRILRRPFRVKALVNSLQAAGFARLAESAGLRCNDSFAGLYDFRADFSRLFPRFLHPRGKFHLAICHPGTGDSSDPIGEARVREATALQLIPLLVWLSAPLVRRDKSRNEASNTTRS